MIRIAHLGAGHHAPNKRRRYEQLLYQSLSTDSSLETCCAIEASELTNTGRGSNVNIEGKVQCDASFIKFSDNVIRCGSMFNIAQKHPTECVLEVYRQLEHWQSPVNKPYILDYDNLHLLGILIDDQSDPLLLITESAAKTYSTYKSQIGSRIGPVADPSEVCDTIGVADIDIEKRKVEIMCSSGGNFLKLPNRIGCAAIIGSGIDFTLKKDGTQVTAMCSGNGEQICQLKLASYIVQNIDTNQQVEESYVSQVETLVHHLEKLYQVNGYFGLVLCVTEKDQSTILYLHTTETFCWGFRYKNKIDVVLSRSKQSGKVTYGEFLLRH